MEKFPVYALVSQEPGFSKKLGRGGRPYCALVNRRSGQACVTSLLAPLAFSLPRAVSSKVGCSRRSNIKIFLQVGLHDQKSLETTDTAVNSHSWQQFQPKNSEKATATAVPTGTSAQQREGKVRARPSITSCVGEEAQLALITTMKPAMQSAVLVTEETRQGNNTKIKTQTQEKMHFLQPSFSTEMVLAVVTAGGGKLLLGRNTMCRHSLSAHHEIGRKQPGLEHKVAINSTQKKPNPNQTKKKKALSGLTSVQKYIQRTLLHIKLQWHAPSAQASRSSIFLALPLF